MGHTFALGEGNQPLGRALGPHAHHGGAQALRQTDVLLQRFGVACLDAVRLLLRRLDVDGVPPRAQTARDARAGAEHARRQRVRAHADHHPFRDEGRFEPFARPVAGRLLPHFVGHGAQGELAQRGQIALAEEIRERLLDLFRLVDLALTQPAAQFLHRDIDVDDLVGAVEEGIGHGLAHAHAGGAGDGVVERLEVLDVDRRQHVNASLEQFEHVFVALGVPRARHIRVRQLIDHADPGMTPHDGVDVHLLEHGAAVLDPAARHDLEVLHLRLGLGAAIGLDDADNDVEAARAQGMRLLQHLVGLAHARRRADVDAQACAVLLFEALEQGVGRGSVLRHDHYRGIGARASSARLRSSTFTTGSPNTPSCRGSMCASTSWRTSSGDSRRCRATRATW